MSQRPSTMNLFRQPCRCWAGTVRRFRRDENGQVLVLSAVMVLTGLMLALATFNAGDLIARRIRTQNAVDAAADTFAAYQARGLNLAQHLNDVHYLANWTIFGLESTAFGLRTLCPFTGLRPPPIFYDPSTVTLCCDLLKGAGVVLDIAQETISTAILMAQAGIEKVFPPLAAYNANRLASANGADPVSEWAGDSLKKMAAALGWNLDNLPQIPPVASFVLDHIYAVPLDPGQVVSLNIAEATPPNYLPWKSEELMIMLVEASDLACIPFGSEAAGSHSPFGWTDTYYCGGPAYNTWVAGNQPTNILPYLDRLPWLQPSTETAADDLLGPNNSPVFDQRGLAPPGSSTHNPAFMAIASSQVGGSPLMERSSHKNFQNKWAEPELISVHIGNPGSDLLVKSLLIWH